MWPFNKPLKSILVIDDETGIQQTYLYRLDKIETYPGEMKDCISLYRKGNPNKHVEYITFEKQFIEKCLEDDTWFEKAIVYNAKKDLKKYCQELQFKSLVKQHTPYENGMIETINNFLNKLTFENKACFVFGVITGYIIGKVLGI